MINASLLLNQNEKMNIVTIILSILATTIVLVLVIGLFMKKGYDTFCEMIIDAPHQKVFDYIKHIKNQDNFNKWVMMDPDMKKEFRGTDATVGFVYAWNGNKEAGEGEQEIKAIEEGKRIEMEIRFVRPLAGIAYATMATESLSDNQTKVTWSTNAKIRYPLNIMVSVIVKMLEKDMRTSLTTLKNILER
jgi:uncharacterized protein YndB with AHSA1/START domain